MLGAFGRHGGTERRLLGVILPGETAGEMALISGTPHFADVVALRDSEILSLPRADFFAAAALDPMVMIEAARLMAPRAMRIARGLGGVDPNVFGFIGVTEGPRVRPLADQLARAVEGFGLSVALIGSASMAETTAWFSQVEHGCDVVIYVAEPEETAWAQWVSRQVDRLFRVAAGDRPPPPGLGAAPEAGPADLLLVHRAASATPRGSAAWSAALNAARLFHVRLGVRADINRLARVITGRAVGLVLSGGGARAYAHIGAIRALHSRGVPIDFIGGVSMGAIVGAGVAMGWDDAELDQRIRKAFVDSSPVDDVALPLIAMTTGGKVRVRLAEHFGERQIADLWLPFFCLSSNLTTGAYHLHDRGRVREALAASSALPGVLPPVIEGDDVLVDGAVMKNFPVDLMRALNPGPIVGVDVGHGRSVTAHELERPESLGRWFLSGDWRKGPPIISLLIRSATVTAERDAIAVHEATDVLVLPMVDAIEIRDWKAYDAAVAAGETAMLEALDRLDRPVTELRRGPRHPGDGLA
jgi:NTE family protein